MEMGMGNLDTLIKDLRQLLRQEYQRGQQDALHRVVEAMKRPGARDLKQPWALGGKLRARRGSARAFIERVLNDKGTATVPQIMASASSSDEKAVSMSAIRFELYRGKKDRRYRNTKGRWSLPIARAKT